MPAERLELETALGHFDRLLLDTCVLIDEFKKPSGRLSAINRPQRATSVVALWEFLHIARGTLLPEAERRDRRAWLSDQEIVMVPFSDGAGRSFEVLVEAEGPTSVADALLAAQCLFEAVPIVTSNVKDFKDVAGLRYVAW
jgi:predicted nucleic acid-binding protein